MRPDEYKQSRSRKHQSKLRGSTEAAEIQEKRKERRLKSNKSHKSREEEKSESEGDEDSGKPIRRSFWRPKLGSNAHRYEELPAEDSEVDSEVDDFNRLIDDSENMSFEPSTYFQFKEEKEWNENIVEADEVYQRLMNIRFDELNLSLCSVSLHERLDLTDDILVKESDNSLDSALDMKHPIVPKQRSVMPVTLVQKKIGAANQPDVKNGLLASNTKPIKGEKDSQSKLRIPISSPSPKPKQPGTSGTMKRANVITSAMNSSPTASKSAVKDDDDIDDFLRSLENEEDASSSKFLLPNSNKKRPAQQIKAQNKNSEKSVGDDDMEEWLDDVLK